MSGELAAQVPEPVRSLLDRLRGAGHRAALVGGCVRDLVSGRPVRDFDVATSATADIVLALFPRAVPVGLRHGTVMVPTPAGPVDVTTFRGADLDEDLSRRDFTMNALALDPAEEGLRDPQGGLADFRAGRLRAVGSARDRLAEDPVRALRAARFAATLELSIDPALEAALPAAADGVCAAAGERIRAELDRLLGARRPGVGIALLRRSGIESRLLPGAREDAARVVDALPVDPVLRWAAWLRGTRAGRLLARFRSPRPRSRQVERLLELHPVEEKLAPREPAVRRALARHGEEGLQRLLQLRRAELGEVREGEAVSRLAELEACLARVRAAGPLALARADLALRGEDVMRLLEIPAGRDVGRALRHLTECVLEDPGCNQPELLEIHLRRWWRDRSAAADG